MIPDLSGLVLVLFRFGWLAKREPFESISITLAQLTCDSKNQSTIRKQTSLHATQRGLSIDLPVQTKGHSLEIKRFLVFFFFQGGNSAPLRTDFRCRDQHLESSLRNYWRNTSSVINFCLIPLIGSSIALYSIGRVQILALCSLEESRITALLIFRASLTRPIQARSRAQEGCGLLLLVAALGILFIGTKPSQAFGPEDVAIVPVSTLTNHVRHIFFLDLAFLELFSVSKGSKGMARFSLFIGFLPCLHTSGLESSRSQASQIFADALLVLLSDLLVFLWAQARWNVSIQLGDRRRFRGWSKCPGCGYHSGKDEEGFLENHCCS